MKSLRTMSICNITPELLSEYRTVFSREDIVLATVSSIVKRGDVIKVLLGESISNCGHECYHLTNETYIETLRKLWDTTDPVKVFLDRVQSLYFAKNTHPLIESVKFITKESRVMYYRHCLMYSTLEQLKLFKEDMDDLHVISKTYYRGFFGKESSNMMYKFIGIAYVYMPKRRMHTSTFIHTHSKALKKAFYHES